MDNNFFYQKKILITGGAGFIGSNLAHRLVDLGAKVSLVDNLSPDYGGNLFNIVDIRDRVSLHVFDICDAQKMNSLVENHDVVFHLAAQTSHLDSMMNPLVDLEVNAKASLILLEACRQYNPNIKIVFASTRQVYGKPCYVPVDEKHPISPVDINGVNKLTAEWSFSVYHHVYHIPVTILRLTNTIGPGMRVRDNRQIFLGVWVRLLLEGKPFEVWGGEQLRDFTYVDDAVDAFLLAAEKNEAKGKIFNVGGCLPVSLKDLAQGLLSIYGGGEYVVREFPEERKKIDINSYYAKYDFITDVLGWKPKVSLQTALQKILIYYKKNIKHYL